MPLAGGGVKASTPTAPVIPSTEDTADSHVTSFSAQKRICEEKGDGWDPSTSIITSGHFEILITGLKAKLRNTTGAKAKNILIFFASSGICENAIKPVGQKKELDLLVLPQKNRRGSPIEPYRGSPTPHKLNSWTELLRHSGSETRNLGPDFSLQYAWKEVQGKRVKKVFPVPMAMWIFRAPPHTSTSPSYL